MTKREGWTTVAAIMLGLLAIGIAGRSLILSYVAPAKEGVVCESCTKPATRHLEYTENMEMTSLHHFCEEHAIAYLKRHPEADDTTNWPRKGW